MRIIPRFSLRTLLCLVLLAGSVMGLCAQWAPWGIESVLRGHSEIVSHVAFAPDGLKAVTASFDKTARIWDVRNGASLLELRGHRDIVNSAVFSPNGKFVVTTSNDKTVRAWDVSTGLEINRRSFEASSNCARFLSGGKQIAVGFDDSIIRVFDTNLSDKAKLLGHKAAVYDLDSSPDNQYIASCGTDGTIRIWAKGGAVFQAEGEPESGNAPMRYSVRFSPDGKHLVGTSASKNGTHASVYSSTTFKLERVLFGQGMHIGNAEFSPDGKRIFTASKDGTCRIWDAVSGEHLYTLSGTYGDVSYSPDGQRLIANTRDNSACIWRRRHPEEWWGIALTWGFWLTILFFCALIWSLLGDRIAFKKVSQIKAQNSPPQMSHC